MFAKSGSGEYRFVFIAVVTNDRYNCGTYHDSYVAKLGSYLMIMTSITTKCRFHRDWSWTPYLNLYILILIGSSSAALGRDHNVLLSNNQVNVYKCWACVLKKKNIWISISYLSQCKGWIFILISNKQGPVWSLKLRITFTSYLNQVLKRVINQGFTLYQQLLYLH